MPSTICTPSLPAVLRSLLRRFDEYPQAVPLEILQTALAGMDVSPGELTPFLLFDEDCYRRNLIASGTAYEALLLCWGAGQKSPIHDHRGSGCAFKVLEGVVTETVFEPGTGDRLHSVCRRRYVKDSIAVSQDLDIHEVANLETGPLVTLHVYSPPLVGMTTYPPEVCVEMAEARR